MRCTFRTARVFKPAPINFLAHKRFYSTSTESFDELVREYPQLARQEKNINEKYDANVPTTGPVKVSGFGFSVDPNAGFGKNILNPGVRLTFTDAAGNASRLKYGSAIICTGPKIELGVRVGLLFATGNSERLSEIPKAFEVEQGWDFSFFRYNLLKFQVRELPGTSFWGLYINYGLAFGVQSINSGFLFFNHDNTVPTESARNLFFNSIANKFSKILLLGGLFLYVLAVYSSIQVLTTPVLEKDLEKVVQQTGGLVPPGASPLGSIAEDLEAVEKD